MKKSILSILMLLVVGGLFTGCSGNVESDNGDVASGLNNVEVSEDQLVDEMFEDESAQIEEDVELGELI